MVIQCFAVPTASDAPCAFQVRLGCRRYRQPLAAGQPTPYGMWHCRLCGVYCMQCLKRTGWQGVDGSRVEAVLDLCGLATNKNTVVGDTSALIPSGLRMGTQQRPLPAVA